MKPITEKSRQQRRFLLVLPVLVLPFLTGLFWALGGGRGASAHPSGAATAGLNLRLPDAHFDGRETWDKFNLYEMARQDSARSQAAKQNDPYYELPTQKIPGGSSTHEPGRLVSDLDTKSAPATTDPNEARVHQKLSELYHELERENIDHTNSSRIAPPKNTAHQQESFSGEVDRLEKMMALMHEETGPDPEMQQIETVLDKILQIQNPNHTLGTNDKRLPDDMQPVLAVTPVREAFSVSLLEGRTWPTGFSDTLTAPASLLHGNGFWGPPDQGDFVVSEANAIEAVIHQTQRLVDGATVSLRLLQPLEVAGFNLHPGHVFYGTCAIGGERLSISISSLRAGGSILPVALAVYDLDGMQGVYIPGAITRDAAKQASGNALQNLQVMSLDPTLSAQAAAVGVEAAKGLFGRKAQMISVTVKAGHRVLLRDKNDNNTLR